MNKELIKQRFRKNQKTYKENAIVQKRMAKNLVSLVLNNCGQKNFFKKIFEPGCGSGILTEEIVKTFKFAQLVINDLFEADIKIKDSIFLLGDVEKIEFPSDCSLIISNAMVQWLCDVESFFEKAASALEVGGLFGFTSFDEENFYEIKKIFEVSLEYLPVKILEKMLKKNFEILQLKKEKYVLSFESLFALLKHIKLTGANCVCCGKMMTPKALKEYEAEYIKEFSGFFLTYSEIFFVCKKL